VRVDIFGCFGVWKCKIDRRKIDASNFIELVYIEFQVLDCFHSFYKRPLQPHAIAFDHTVKHEVHGRYKRLLDHLLFVPAFSIANARKHASIVIADPVEGLVSRPVLLENRNGK
jgi:hypothetical protein